MRTVLAATDFSETAALAVERASEIARIHDARLVVCHALGVEPAAKGGPELFVPPFDFQQRVEEATREVLDRAVSELREQGVDASPALEIRANAGDAVAAAAEREGADLVLCGTRGLTGFSRLLLGSTARGIVQRVRVPVLTVHPGDRSPLEATRVLLATDFSDDAARAADALARLLAGRIAEVEVVLAHVCHLPAVVAWLLGGEEGARPLLAELDQGARDSLASVEASLAEKGLRVLTEVREGDPAEVLVGLTREREVGLVAMGTRGHARVRRLLLGRTADRVIQHASCPVLTVRRDES